MKFEAKYPSAAKEDKFEFEYSFVTKSPKLGACRFCKEFTRWIDVLFQVHVCSEHCNSKLWQEYKTNESLKYDNFDKYFEIVKEELSLPESQSSKDILIVVHDQLDYLKDCLNALMAVTKNYHLYIWDNASGKKTQEYLNSLPRELVTVVRSEKNIGFIKPNNDLAAMGKNDYIILLNSDTKVFDQWDTLMVSFLEKHPNVGQVGYWGGYLGPDGIGFGGGNGYSVDYIPGWCFCLSRKLYNQVGLFNKELDFAYCEDADLSLRLKDVGYQIYALHASLVIHYQNKTIEEVEKEGEIDVQATFKRNHEYLKNRWHHYLKNDRVTKKENNGQIND